MHVLGLDWRRLLLDVILLGLVVVVSVGVGVVRVVDVGPDGGVGQVGQLVGVVPVDLLGNGLQEANELCMM